MKTLPTAFTDKMQKLLGDEYPAFLASYEETRRYGLRVNTLKISPEEFSQKSDFHLTPVSWIPGAWYYTQEDGAARHPFYHAGLYYLQEPSAMTPASVLEVRPGDKVLDLCAAPGGKATALGARLGGSGLLVANDISASRCKALLKNIELFGITNAVVTNAAPARLAERFPEYFDCILVDAPCSGEGMFRKDEAVIRAWHPGKNAECAAMQKEIILQAAQMLRPGGRLLYSTCTFDPMEDEEIVRYLLAQCPDMFLLDIPHREGFSPGIGGADVEKCVRLWPHITGGEGHFLALLGKAGGSAEDARDGAPIQDKPVIRYLRTAQDLLRSAGCSQAEAGSAKQRERARRDKRGTAALATTRSAYVNEDGQMRGGRRMKDRAGSREIFGSSEISTAQKLMLAGSLLEETGLALPDGRAVLQGDSVCLYPSVIQQRMLAGIPYLRCGLLLGQFRKDRFEPSQALAMAADLSQAKAVVSLSAGDERLLHYLRGETICLTSDESDGRSGWVVLCVDGHALGWGRLAGGVLKNKYLAGWRINY